MSLKSSLDGTNRAHLEGGRTYREVEWYPVQFVVIFVLHGIVSHLLTCRA